MAQEKYEQYRQFSFLFTVAKVVGSVKVPFVFKVEREGGYTDQNAFFYVFFFCTEISKRTRADEKT